MMHFECPVGALVIYDPSFKFLHRMNSGTLKNEFALGSHTLDAGEGCSLEEFEMFADPLESNGIVLCMVLPEGTSEEMSVYIA